MVDTIAAEYAGKVTVAKLDVDENTATPTEYGVHETPTFILFKNGKAQATKAGMLNKSQLKAFLDAHL
ncbi:thioredoxin family protein [Streptomyces sp. NPDC058157]|uniref:thioredoxin family protein n=1 Tax=Streptomyces sp. NPDC058157 TaxID=3346360 RepID=UPI0036E8AE1B